MRNFFERQEQAKTRTWLLILLYAMGLVVMVGLLYGLFLVTGIFTAGEIQSSSESAPVTFFHPLAILGTILFVLLFVGGGSLYKMYQLSGGGEVIARELGGREITSNPEDPDKQQLRNVVEEMALASGISVPEIFVLEEESAINAFAAGHSPSDAAIGVTRGAIEKLNRDELQGVIAHEYSHIFNEDMKLNVRLLGVLFGIMVISYVGWMLFRGSLYTGGLSSRNRSSGGKGKFAIILLGLGLVLIGSIGVFFGRLIQSAISRQREYLADASAVQYTRNPRGLAGALKKIGGFSKGSQIQSDSAEMTRHFFFSEASSSLFSSLNLFSTHPPLKERIKELDPTFDGDLQETAERTASTPDAPETAQPVSELAGQPGSNVETANKAVQEGEQRRHKWGQMSTREELMDRSGTIDPSNVREAREIRQNMPDELIDATRDPYGATALCIAILLARTDADTREQFLESHAEKEFQREIRNLVSDLRETGKDAFLPLMEMSLSTLKHISRDQYRRLTETMDQIVENRDDIEFFDRALVLILDHHLTTHFEEKPGTAKDQIRHVDQVKQEVTTVLSCFARAGSDSQRDIRRAFASAYENLFPDSSPDIPEEPNMTELKTHIRRLAGCTRDVKKQILRHVTSCILADNEIHPDEYKLLHAFCLIIEVPIPPRLTSHRERSDN